MENKKDTIVKRLIVFTIENILNTLPVFLLMYEFITLGVIPGVEDGYGSTVILITLLPTLGIILAIWDFGIKTILGMIYFIGIISFLKAYTSLYLNCLIDFKKMSFTWVAMLVSIIFFVMKSIYIQQFNIKAEPLKILLVILPIVIFIQPIFADSLQLMWFKRKFGIFVVPSKSIKTGFLKMLVRETAKYMLFFLCPLTIIVPVMRKDGKALHDILLNTQVVQLK